MLDQTDPCPVCGFSAAQLTPPDGEVALRSYPRRYRGVLVRPDEEEAGVVTRPGADGWSALAHAAHVAAALAAVADALRLVEVQDEPTVGLVPEQPVPATDVEVVLGDLATAAALAADAAQRITGKDWSRRARATGGRGLTALDLLAQGVHEGVHHLRLAERAVEEALRAG
ncbi:MAG TPA: DinB family protein [Acidimicrobiales bacterium]|nr:DinB family protein [Acidimicrobiales bacterium]